MRGLSGSVRFFLCLITVVMIAGVAFGQRQPDQEFGPVVSAYLGYLSNEQEVVDDRASRREITPGYYRRNSNRIQALRTTTVRLVRQSGNDYVPELEAVAVDEFRTIFERPPQPATLRLNEVFANKFRFLGSVRTGEVFYVFARLDPYEQADLIQRNLKSSASAGSSSNGASGIESSTRARRVVPK
jgi:hypothetical protein